MGKQQQPTTHPQLIDRLDGVLLGGLLLDALQIRLIRRHHGPLLPRLASLGSGLLGQDVGLGVQWHEVFQDPFWR